VQLSDLSQQLAPRRIAIDAELARLAAATAGDGVVAKTVRYALLTGGKRLRPILCLAAAEAVDRQRAGRTAGDRSAGDPNAGTADTAAADAPARVRAAAAVEIVHTYSLVHDDLPCMDDDDLRRGRPTAHRAFGAVPAALAGFSLIPFACGVLSAASRELGLADAQGAAAVRELCQGAGAAGMVGGQVLDLEAENAPALELDALRTIHAMKTGALFRASLRIGGILAGASPHVADALGSFGASLGLAFQITDDVLDETMDAGALGKTPGKDRGASKSTFASLLGVQAARNAAASESADAVRALREAGIDSPLLEALAEFAVQRDR
jgi:geranylgeranyl pyrophosphate synthase